MLVDDSVLQRAIRREVKRCLGGEATVLAATEKIVLAEVPPIPYSSADKRSHVTYAVDIGADGHLRFSKAVKPIREDQVQAFCEDPLKFTLGQFYPQQQSASDRKASIRMAKEALASFLEESPAALDLYDLMEDIIQERGGERRDIGLRWDALEEALKRRPDYAVTPRAKSVIATTYSMSDWDLSVAMVAQEYGLDVGDPTEHEQASILCLEANPYAQPLFGEPALIADQCGGVPQYRGMASIAKREGLKLSENMGLIRKHFHKEFKEWVPMSIDDCLTLDECVEFILYDDPKSGLSWSVPEHRMRAYERAVSMRRDLLENEYGLSTAQERLIPEARRPPKAQGSRLELTEEQQAGQAAADKLRERAKRRILEEGGDITDYNTMSRVMNQLIDEDPSLAPDNYGWAA